VGLPGARKRVGRHIQREAALEPTWEGRALGPSEDDHLEVSMRESTPSEIQDGTLSVKIAEGNGVCTVSVAGELDLANATTLRHALERAAGGELVLDMSELEFIDSTGIALLVAAHHRLNGNGDVGFRLIGSEYPSVCRVMALTGLEAELPFLRAGRETPRAGT
jgi:anti-anti-sigma factor